MAEPTIADVLHEIETLRREQQALHRTMVDEIAGLRHYIQGLDRDVSTLIRRYAEGEDED